MYRFDNIYTEEELADIKTIVEQASRQNCEVQPQYGRLCLDKIALLDQYAYKIAKLVNNISPMPLASSGHRGVIYSSEYGQPDLPPHFDGDDNDLIVDLQLDSNTDWSLGLDEHVYKMKDSCALAFNPNKYAHWRPHKEFKDGEYVTMLFFRFYNPIRKSDYSHLKLSQDDPAFNDVRAYRDSLQ
jgi:hypothetical protein